MADETIQNTVTEAVERVVGNADIPVWQQGLAGAVNDTYSYANSSLFYAMMPAYYRDYAWRYVRVACQWLDGYVWSLHQAGISGIISTRIASKLIAGLTKQIVGEKLVFKLNTKDVDNGKKSLAFASKWADEQNIIKAVYAAVGFSLAIGTSLLKINKSLNGDLWLEAVRFDNCYYLASFKNEIKEATFLIRNYIDTREGHSNQQFFLVEHRYWREYDKPLMEKKLDGSIEVKRKMGERVAMVCYDVHRVTGTTMNNVMPTQISGNKLNWNEIPKEIRNMIKNDYSTIKIGEEQELGLTTLGVVPLLNGEIDLSVPTGTNFGESMLVGIQDDLITYELASSYQIRDMYLGKGTVYMPKSLNLGDVMNPYGADNGVLNGIGDNKYETLKGIDPAEQQVIVNQFNLRASEWQTIKENAIKNIAVKWSMSPKILSSFLSNGAQQMTATQVDSEDDLSIAFIYHTRAYFKNALNKLLELVLNANGYDANIKVDFASPSLINRDRLLDRVTKELDAGLIDLDEAIRTLNPDLDEEAIQEKVQKAEKLKQEQMMQAFTEMNDDGTFGEANNYDDLGGNNLNGSTSPIQ